VLRPFNEHIAPLFELVSIATWSLSGRRLVHAPAAFTVASLVPTFLMLPVLRKVVRRECGSDTTSLACVAMFAITWLPIETAWWYSASSFAWALLATLIAWGFALRARDTGRLRWWIGAAAAALAAPGFSAIGLLAGPVVTLRSVAEPTSRRGAVGLVGLTPLLGTAAYLVLVVSLRHHGLVTDSVRRNANPLHGLLHLAMAPADVLLPGLLGVRNLDARLPSAWAIGLFVLGLAGVLMAAWRSAQRPLILAGLALVLGGYGLTYPFRGADGPHWALEVGRYHLFPHLGLAFFLAAGLRGGLARFDGRPRASLATVTVLAIALCMLHRQGFRAYSASFRFPDQARTMIALERLERACVAHRISRDQVLTTFVPASARWCNPGTGPLVLLGPAATRPIARPHAEVRAVLLSALPADDWDVLTPSIGRRATDSSPRTAGSGSLPIQ
jgi:hypothetical protein